MTRLTVPANLLVATVLAGDFGCGPRADVAKQSILDRIDDVLGKMDVQRAEIESGVEAARKGADGVRSARIKAEVSLEQLEEKARDYEERMGQWTQQASRLRELIVADKPAELGGKTHTVAQIKEMAVKVIQARKDAEAKVNGFKTARENLAKVVAGLKKNEQDCQARIASLKTKLVSLDAEMAAAKSMKAAAKATGGEDATLMASLDKLDDKVAGLATDVRVQLQEESEGQRVASRGEGELAEIDTLLRSSQTPGDLVAELDAMIGQK